MKNYEELCLKSNGNVNNTKYLLVNTRKVKVLTQR